MPPDNTNALTSLEFHVMLALTEEPLYGYAIKERVEHESAHALAPRAGSLYRVLARLMTSGHVTEAEPAEALPPHPGLARRYYALTPEGRRALAAEAQRLRAAAALAEDRLGAARSRT